MEGSTYNYIFPNDSLDFTLSWFSCFCANHFVPCSDKKKFLFTTGEIWLFDCGASWPLFITGSTPHNLLSKYHNHLDGRRNPRLALTHLSPHSQEGLKLKPLPGSPRTLFVLIPKSRNIINVLFMGFTHHRVDK